MQDLAQLRLSRSDAEVIQQALMQEISMMLMRNKFLHNDFATTLLALMIINNLMNNGQQSRITVAKKESTPMRSNYNYRSSYNYSNYVSSSSPVSSRASFYSKPIEEPHVSSITSTKPVVDTKPTAPVSSLDTELNNDLARELGTSNGAQDRGDLSVSHREQVAYDLGEGIKAEDVADFSDSLSFKR